MTTNGNGLGDNDRKSDSHGVYSNDGHKNDGHKK